MSLFQENGDWLEQDAIATALAGQTTFTVSFWFNPDAAAASPFPLLFVVADSLTAPLQWITLFHAGSGVLGLVYDDGLGNPTEPIALYVAGEWRFVAVTFSPGTTPGTWKIRARSRLATAAGTAWEFDLTHDNRRKPANNLWAKHSLSTPIAPANVFSYYGHVKHVKVWLAELTGEQLWRESQLGLPIVLDTLLQWNPVQVDFDDQQYRGQLGSIAGGYVSPIGAVTPGEDTTVPPIGYRPPCEAVVLGVPSPNPTLPTGGLTLAAENLQGRLGLAGRLCAGGLSLIGGCLMVALAGNPALQTGNLTLDGNPLTVALADNPSLQTGCLTLSGAPLAAAVGVGAPIDAGVGLWQGSPLAPALGLAGPLCPGAVVLRGEGLYAQSSSPPNIIEGFAATVTVDTPVVTVDAGAVAATVDAGVGVAVDSGGLTAAVDPAAVNSTTGDSPSVTVS